MKNSFTLNDKIVPFVKWVGGKTQLLTSYEPYFPKFKVAGYLEPFVGGGAVFFHLAQKISSCIPFMKEKVILSDANSELITAYQVIRDKCDELISSLEVWQKRYNRDHNSRRRLKLYLTVRSKEYFSPLERAVRFIFLNRTCFNGLFRVNSKGKFNVPMGKYSNPRIFEENNLRAMSEILKKVTLCEDDFESVARKFAKPDWFVYFDPPYIPIARTANFTSYTKQSFGIAAQKRLAKLFSDLDEMGCYCMLSNSGHKLINQYYPSFPKVKVLARRAINSKGTRRGNVMERLVLGRHLASALTIA